MGFPYFKRVNLLAGRVIPGYYRRCAEIVGCGVARPLRDPFSLALFKYH
jgi:hypothetical protein